MPCPAPAPLPRRARDPRGFGLLPRRDLSGVSGVVAASLGVVLISVLLGMVVTFWVPAWGYDNEVGHSREVVNAFAEFKNALELQALAANTNQTLTTTFPLGVGGVPLFGAPNPGQLSYQYLDGGKIRFRLNVTDATGQANFTSAGSLSYLMPNRYFVRQEMAYESGAVIVAQADGQTARLTPPFRFTNGTQGIDVSVTLFSLEGTQSLVTGVDSHTVSSKLSAVQSFTYSWASNTTLTLNVTTKYTAAWSAYFMGALNASSVGGGLVNVSSYPPSAPETVTLRLSGVRSLSVTVALVQVKVE